MKRTTAPGSSGGQFVDDNPSLGIVGTLGIAEDKNLWQEELCAPIEGAGLALSGSDSAQLWKAMRKVIKERSREVGEIFTLLTRKTPVGFGTGTEDTYFTGKCLTDIATSEDISATNWPDLVPFLRDVKTIFKNGISGEISSPSVTNWDISSNVATLTFANNADTIAFLTALSEDQAVHGSFTNWRTVTLASAIGNISAGTYAITGITPASRTITFAITAANASGAVTATVDFFAHRISGSTTTARLFSARGLTVHGANDSDGYFVAGGLRRRGYFQGHFQRALSGSAFLMQNPTVKTINITTGTSDGVAATTGAPVTDGTNGTPRFAKETHGPALAVHVYIHGGRYIA